MLSAILIGAVAACLSVVPGFIHATFPNAAWLSPSFILGVAALAMVLQRFVIDRKPGYRGYDGLADLMIHIHSPAQSDSALRWTVRGFISFCLSLFGGVAGPEGAAVEGAHAFALLIRSRSARWFEQRRRTDAAGALAAGVAAAFGAPFAGMLVPIETGMGGRTISTAISAIVGFLGAHYLLNIIPGEHFSIELFDISGAVYGFHFANFKEWMALITIAVMTGCLGAGTVRFIRYSQDSLLDLFQTQAWMRTLAGGILLFLVVLVYKGGHHPSISLLQEVAWGRKAIPEVALLLFTRLLALALVLAAFGTLGVFWPVFMMGGFVGFLVNHGLFHSLDSFGPIAVLAGASALWASVIGVPVAGAVLAFEVTHNLYVLLPCLVTGFIAKELRVLLKTESMMERDLKARGVGLLDGRTESVLDGLHVRDAMVSDHETVHEQEPVSEIHSRLLKSKYPFLPVINSQGSYIGLLTVDMVQESWRNAVPTASNSPLTRLLEAKDLLYRTGFKTPSVRPGDRLSATAGLFTDVPCIPVLSDENRVIGLLFVHNVRLSYDREVAKRSLAFHLDEG